MDRWIGVDSVRDLTGDTQEPKGQRADGGNRWDPGPTKTIRFDKHGGLGHNRIAFRQVFQEFHWFDGFWLDLHDSFINKTYLDRGNGDPGFCATFHQQTGKG